MYGNNIVHETAIIGDKVKLGERNVIGPYVIIHNGVEIGNDNIFQGHSVIGSCPEHRIAWSNNTNLGVKIGNGNRFNEFVTVNGGYVSRTEIHDNCYFLRGGHVGHCAIIETGTGVHCNVIVGGHAHVMKYSYLGLGCVLNPKVVIGAYSLVGSNSLILQSDIVGPFTKWVGSPGRCIGDNTVKKQAFYMAGNNEQDIRDLNKEFVEIRKKVNG
jgi:UDP-N-acetylglucosamine acyltransferase